MILYFLAGLVSSGIWHAVAAATCIGSEGNASVISQLLADGGPGAVVELCPGAVINLTEFVTFAAENQTLQTQGLPVDETRATLLAQSGSTSYDPGVSMYRNGNESLPGLNYASVRNIIIDGNSTIDARSPNYEALLQMGSEYGAVGQSLSYVTVKNCGLRTCVSVLQDYYSEDPIVQSVNFSITDSEILNSGLYGLQLAGINTTIARNTFEIAANYGIDVIGNSSSSAIINNTFTAPAAVLGHPVFGAVTLANEISAIFTDMTITGNHFDARAFMAAGLLLGHCAGVDAPVDACQPPGDDTFYGPLLVSNNTFSGNITFAVVADFWNKGLTVVDNDLSGLLSPASFFTSPGRCEDDITTLFRNNSRLIATAIAGPENLQEGFVTPAAVGGTFNCVRWNYELSIRSS